MYAQVAVATGHPEGTFHRTFILPYRKRIATHTTHSRTLQGSFTPT